ncbi:arginine--tRNA ligase [Caldimonas thermodepolymerans]|jgi:arginyl-tRNA synthetase|uniref:Arginine--tRNA ligase n=1 Tax=Caldimonas thermodepolymerans TaxID=215580 RepID=A0A2S5T4Y2_9BURK|nr:arginine--tRNA ligase [Caldimonas thermodepolymerans]PPE70054.1 arginine--tRNA ligase [Caldimonas thermodepolymerans]QPC31797.1 arginine--tRNA ligase [Caldimonas thermodepolymerans]RDI01698.1 arginyl-tRNA synthetase [Caldimonas thermodepolymerans]TCP05836.1 arginyl-tRNA synthetase [Caldimonas thermodepolymerans]UZG48224.1 arginine--tRNA ligase [Caldimonas thermodepolymerans]
MIRAKQELLQALADELAALAPGQAPVAAFENPKQAAHGDLACTSAMQLAKPLKKNPRELAQTLVERLGQREAFQRWVESMEIAGPGFINLRLKPAAKQQVVAEVLAAGDGFGRQPSNGRRVMVEFVSANPTGPLHVGHGRQAALGDAICNLFEAQGWDVTREFYYNDAGVQIGNLALSVQARLKGLKPGDPGWPEAAYNGEYIADIAADFAAKKTVKADDREFTASGDPEDLDGIRQFAVAYLRHEQDLDLQAFGVKFDNYFLESSLYTSGRVEQTVQRLVDAGKTYEQDGALWLRTTEYGDDKDRVMRKSDGTYTYFVPDVAYHINKWERGFTKVVNIQGSDHHGTIARVRAGLQAAGVGIPAGYPDYVLHKMVTVMKGGQEVKISKRAGSYVTLRDLIEWTSRDAVRFFLISRKADTEFVFDVDLALEQDNANPVYYVQYAHARICSVIRNWQSDHGGDPATLASADLSHLVQPAEAALMLKLAEFPAVLKSAADSLAPHDVAFYLREVASAYHTYYAEVRFLVEDAELTRARMALLTATKQVLRNGLAILGVGAPEKM